MLQATKMEGGLVSPNDKICPYVRIGKGKVVCGYIHKARRICISEQTRYCIYIYIIYYGQIRHVHGIHRRCSSRTIREDDVVHKQYSDNATLRTAVVRSSIGDDMAAGSRENAQRVGIDIIG